MKYRLFGISQAWTAIDRLLSLWKFGVPDKRKWEFLQDVAVSVLLYGYTTWTQIKCLLEKLNENNKNMLFAVLNESWKQHPKNNLTSHLTNHSKTSKKH